ncbi:hypothetical protein PRIPAC_72581 [Pristionchus pacificus]|uniref:Uncharacterized protein n=1 Tax=Pristionchus pacificus TaxID=54126 RepID=A0A2A6C085_PRIPA|nr:hypothetical protein PRIPAC_72581 [Pristionchus pacificus]|eukprot:PDM71516.1 hypothetical protein PRIPAC_37923 [Pristionchus pacificus]
MQSRSFPFPLPIVPSLFPPPSLISPLAPARVRFSPYAALSLACLRQHPEHQVVSKMSERKLGHEHLKNLYKGKEQTPVSVASKYARPSRTTRAAGATAPSRSSPGRRAWGAARATEVRPPRVASRSRGTRDSEVETPSRKRTIKELPPASANDKSNRNRTSSKSPHTVRTPTTPNTPPQESRGRSRKSSTKKKGPEVQENTVFENDAGVTAPTRTTGGASKGDTRQSLDGKGEGGIQLAAARIKERKLQWKKEGAEKSPVKTDPRQAETSAPPSEGSGYYDPQQYETKKEGEKKDVKHEANNTIRERTVFDNDDSHSKPAVVKEEKPHLQWAAGAGPPPEDGAGMSTPRKKKTATDPHQSPKKGSPASPNLVSPTRQKTNPRSTTGSTDKDHGTDPAEQMVSCYITPTMQHAAFNSAEMIKKMEEEKQK